MIVILKKFILFLSALILPASLFSAASSSSSSSSTKITYNHEAIQEATQKMFKAFEANDINSFLQALDTGANPSAIYRNQETIFQHLILRANKSTRIPFIKEFIKRYPLSLYLPINNELDYPFHYIIIGRDIPLIRALFEFDKKLVNQDSYHALRIYGLRSPLCIAINNKEITELLIANGANVLWSNDNQINILINAQAQIKRIHQRLDTVLSFTYVSDKFKSESLQEALDELNNIKCSINIIIKEIQTKIGSSTLSTYPIGLFSLILSFLEDNIDNSIQQRSEEFIENFKQKELKETIAETATTLC